MRYNCLSHNYHDGQGRNKVIWEGVKHILRGEGVLYSVTPHQQIWHTLSPQDAFGTFPKVNFSISTFLRETELLFLNIISKSKSVLGHASSLI